MQQHTVTNDNKDRQIAKVKESEREGERNNE